MMPHSDTPDRPPQGHSRDLGSRSIARTIVPRLPSGVDLVLNATGLIVICELALWTAGLPLEAEVEWEVVGRRLVQTASVAGAAAPVSAATLLPTLVRLDSAILAALIGGLAAIALLSIPFFLLRS